MYHKILKIFYCLPPQQGAKVTKITFFSMKSPIFRYIYPGTTHWYNGTSVQHTVKKIFQNWTKWYIIHQNLFIHSGIITHLLNPMFCDMSWSRKRLKCYNFFILRDNATYSMSFDSVFNHLSSGILQCMIISTCWR